MARVDTNLLRRLATGRDALDELNRSRPDPRLIELLGKLDSALDELRAGTSGVCLVCHEPIPPAALDQDPLLTVCLECMSPEQRGALQLDLELAGQVQRRLLPQTPVSHDGWEIAYLWEPFGVVSGDHIDLVQPADPAEPLHLLLGDVAGKGMAAALLQSQLHALFRALTPMKTTLSQLLGRANHLFFEATSETAYATLTVARLCSDGCVSVANAGHPRPLIADRRGVRPIEDASVPLGMISDVTYVEREIRMRPGDTLLFYTDGVTEAWRDEEQYGVARTAAALRRARALPLGELLAACRTDVKRFINGVPWADDMTMVAVRRAGLPRVGAGLGL